MELVYFIRDNDTGEIKIGTTTQKINKRIKQIEKECNRYNLELIGFFQGNYIEEIKLHIKFANLNTTREWHKPNKELIQYIQKNTFLYPIKPLIV